MSVTADQCINITSASICEAGYGKNWADLPLCHPRFAEADLFFPSSHQADSIHLPSTAFVGRP